MNKTVKKTLKITGITLLVIIVLLITLPFLFKGKIVEIAKKEVNKSLNAKVDFNEFGLNLFRNFPDFSLTVDDFSVIGVGEFKNDTLASVKRLNVVIDLFSVFGSEGYKVKKVIIDQPKVNLITLADGKSNMDIMKPDDKDEPDTDTSSTPFKLHLNELKIKNAQITYRDDSTRTQARVSNLNFDLSGDLTDEKTTLNVLTNIDSVTYTDGGVTLLNKAKIYLKSKVEADLKNSKYSFAKTEFKLNEILLQADGWVAMPDSTAIDMDVQLSAPQTQFKDWLSLIPAIYMTDFDKIKTEGNLAFSAFAKGRMQGESYPAFGLNLKVDNAMFRYPDLPKSVNNINILADISSKGGSLDNMVIDVSGFKFDIDKNPFSLALLVRTPISDPNIKVDAKGNLNLGIIKDVYPLGDQTLNGLLKIDIALQGHLSSVEQERYEDFNAHGNLIVENLKYTSKDFPKPIDISTANLEFTSKYLDLKQLNAKFGSSDFYAAGKIDNYLAYVFKDATIRGSLDTKSNHFDLKDIMSESEAPKGAAPATPAPAQQEAATVVEVPKNIDFTLSTAITKLIYDNIELNNVKGNIAVKDGILNIKNLILNTLGATVGLSGSYSTAQITAPTVKMNLDVKELDIQQAFKTFNTVQKLMPIAEHTNGKFSTKIELTSLLDKTLSPVLKTVNAKGTLQTSRIQISGVEAFEKIANATKVEKLRKPTLDKVNLSYEIVNGNVNVKPFDIKMANSNCNVSGSLSLEQALDFDLKMNVPRSEFGSSADAFVSSLSGKAGVKAPDNIKFDILIGGTVLKPTVKVNASGMANELKEEIKKVVEEKVQDLKNKANDEIDKAIAEATKQKEKLVAEATKQANTIRAEAKKSGDKIMDEASQQAQKVVNEAKNPIAKVAAQKLADKGKKEAQAKVDKGNAEADKQANDLIKQAEQKGDQLIEQAKTKKL